MAIAFPFRHQSRAEISNERTTMSNNLPTVPYTDALLRAGEELAPGGEFGGTLLKFSKGRYYLGDEEMKPGSEFIAHISGLRRGYVKFVDSKLIDQKIVRVTDGPE